jgi:hypothetical protein
MNKRTANTLLDSGSEDELALITSKSYSEPNSYLEAVNLTNKKE